MFRICGTKLIFFGFIFMYLGNKKTFSSDK